jgi:DNA-binding SARP family transcriptional activator
MGARVPRRDREPGVRVRLLDGFAVVVDGDRLDLSTAEARLMAFLTLHDGMRSRPFVAGNLWPDLDEPHARGNLRSALWRLRSHDIELVDGVGDQLGVAAHVGSDTDRLRRVATALLNGHEPVVLPASDQLGFDLLPGWYDDWVLYERERLRQLCLHALERLAGRLLDRGEFGAALDAALTAVRSEPLRESAHRMAVRIHLAEGNVVEATRQYETYRALVHAELGVDPTAEFTRMLTGARQLTAVAGPPRRASAGSGRARRPDRPT